MQMDGWMDGWTLPTWFHIMEIPNEYKKHIEQHCVRLVDLIMQKLDIPNEF